MRIASILHHAHAKFTCGSKMTVHCRRHGINHVGKTFALKTGNITNKHSKVVLLILIESDVYHNGLRCLALNNPILKTPNL